MPDKFDSLWDGLVNEAEDIPMLPPSEIRRLGDRRRTRRHVGVAAGALGISLLAGAAVWTGSVIVKGDDEPQWAGTPTAAVSTPSPSASGSSSAPASPTPSDVVSTSVPPTSTEPTTSTEEPTTEATSTEPTEEPTTAEPTATETDSYPPISQPSLATLPTTSEIFLNEPGDMKVRATYKGWGQAAMLICQKAQLPAKTVYIREFDAQADTAENNSVAIAAVLGFNTPEEATKARKQVISWYANCGKSGVETYPDPGIDVVMDRITVPGGAQPFGGYAMGSIMTNPDKTGTYEDVFVIQANARLMIVSQYFFAQQDHNCGSQQGGEAEMCPIYDRANELGLRLTSR